MIDTTLDLARFDNKLDKHPKQARATWPDLRAKLTTHKTRAEKDGPLFSPTRYADGATRGNDGVIHVSCFVADIDDGTPVSVLRPLWQTPDGAPIAYALYSSFSSTMETPKYRVVFPLSQPVPAAEWPSVWLKLNYALMNGHSDPARKDPAGLYYLPSCPLDRESEAFADISEGVLLNPSLFPDPPPEEIAYNLSAAGSRAGRARETVGAYSEGGNRPGDDYNQRGVGDALELLEQAGWAIRLGRGDIVYLRRPGKIGSEWSATFGHPMFTAPGTFYPFTSSAEPFESRKCYSPFAVYAYLKCGKDFAEAARRLGAAGYGDQGKQGAKRNTAGSARPSAHSVDGEDGPDKQAEEAPAEWESIVPLGEYNLPAFPVRVFPPWLSTFVSDVANATQTPSDLAAMLSLSALAVCAQNKVKVSARSGWVEPTNLYTVTVLGPANRKSAVDAAIKKPIEEFEKAERERLRPEIAAQQSFLRILQERIKIQEKKASTASEAVDREAAQDQIRLLSQELATTPEPGDFRILVEDTTPEKLGSLMAENGGSMACLSAEGDLFDQMSGRYSKGVPNQGVFLKGHSGEMLLVDRVGRKGDRVESPALTLGLAIQPDVIRGLMAQQALRGRGLIGRILFSLPQDFLGFRDVNAAPIEREVTARYAQAIEALLKIEMAKDDWGKPVAHLLTFSRRAHDLLLAYQDRIEVDLRPGGDLGDIQDWGGKLCGAIVRIAGLLHLANHASPYQDPFSSPISAETFENAALIGDYLTKHAHAAFAEMGADETKDFANLILAWIKRTGESKLIETNGSLSFKIADAYKSLFRRFKQSTDMDAPLQLLEDRGYIRITPPTDEERKHNGRGVASVNPELFREAEPNPADTSTAPEFRDFNEINATVNSKSQSDRLFRSKSVHAQGCGPVEKVDFADYDQEEERF